MRLALAAGSGSALASGFASALAAGAGSVSVSGFPLAVACALRYGFAADLRAALALAFAVPFGESKIRYASNLTRSFTRNQASA